MGRTPVYTPINPSVVESTEERQDRISAAVSKGTGVPTGTIWGLPEPPEGDVWVETSGASVITGVSINSIRVRLSRSERFRNPWPTPVKYLGLLLWPKKVIEAWAEAEAEAD